MIDGIIDNVWYVVKSQNTGKLYSGDYATPKLYKSEAMAKRCPWFGHWGMQYREPVIERVFLRDR